MSSLENLQIQADKPTAIVPASPSLLGVPLELRDKIYQYVLGDVRLRLQWDVNQLCLESAPDLSILLVSKQIRQEAISHFTSLPLLVRTKTDYTYMYRDQEYKIPNVLRDKISEIKLFQYTCQHIFRFWSDTAKPLYPNLRIVEMHKRANLTLYLDLSDDPSIPRDCSDYDYEQDKLAIMEDVKSGKYDMCFLKDARRGVNSPLSISYIERYGERFSQHFEIYYVFSTFIDMCGDPEPCPELSFKYDYYADEIVERHWQVITKDDGTAARNPERICLTGRRCFSCEEGEEGRLSYH